MLGCIAIPAYDGHDLKTRHKMQMISCVVQRLSFAKGTPRCLEREEKVVVFASRMHNPGVHVALIGIRLGSNSSVVQGSISLN